LITRAQEEYPIRILHRYRPQQDRVEHRPHGRRHADPHAEDQNGRHGERRAALESAQCESGILPETAHIGTILYLTRFPPRH